MSRLIAIAISDVHVSLNTREIAISALKQALSKAEENNIPLIIAGDLHDTKAILRGECINSLIQLFKDAKVPLKVLIGNHDKLNEKGEGHSLEFLRPYVDIIDKPRFDKECGVGFIPYQSSNEAFLSYRNMFTIGDILVVHQGFLGAHMGEYIKDESSVNPDDVANFTVISGHYHKHQSLGTVTYIGSPYTITSAEANDPFKGFIGIYEDGTITRYPTNLRRHINFALNISDLDSTTFEFSPGDIVTLKVHGNTLDLDKLNKNKLIKEKFNGMSIKLDKIYEDSSHKKIDLLSIPKENILDSFIELDDTIDINQKSLIKKLSLEILNETR